MSDSTEQEDIIDWAIAYRTSMQVVPEAVVEGPKEGSQTTRADDGGRQRGGVRAKAEEACKSYRFTRRASADTKLLPLRRYFRPPRY